MAFTHAEENEGFGVTHTETVKLTALLNITGESEFNRNVGQYWLMCMKTPTLTPFQWPRLDIKILL